MLRADAPEHAALLRTRVHILTGKGGVGKSTLTAALALLATRIYDRVLLVELAGQCSAATLLGGDVTGYSEIVRRPGLFTLSVTPEASMEEYLVRELHSRRLYQLVFKNPITGPFLAAVPGLEDLVSIGKVMDLERAQTKAGTPAWDIIFLDAPATGQGLNLLRVSKAMMEMTRRGPFYNNTRLIHDLLEDPERVMLHLVTLPEEMPVAETLELFQSVRQELKIQPGVCFVNQLRRAPLPPELADGLETLVPGSGPDAALAEALLDAAKTQAARVRLEASYLNRLQEALPMPRVHIPRLPQRTLGPQEVEHLAGLLAETFLSPSERSVSAVGSKAEGADA